MRLQQRNERINELQREIDRLLNEYQDLFDLKVQLDTELKAYHNLLEGEETRFHFALFLEMVLFFILFYSVFQAQYLAAVLLFSKCFSSIKHCSVWCQAQAF